MNFSSILVGVFLASVPWGLYVQYLYNARYQKGLTAGVQGANQLFMALLQPAASEFPPSLPRPNVPRSEA